MAHAEGGIQKSHGYNNSMELMGRLTVKFTMASSARNGHTDDLTAVLSKMECYSLSRDHYPPHITVMAQVASINVNED